MEPFKNTFGHILFLRQDLAWFKIKLSDGLELEILNWYFQVFASPWAASIDIEERHAQLTYQISPWPVDNPAQGDNNVDRLQVFLLAHIILLSTDQVRVKDVPQVSKLQDNYLTMLHRYLKFKYNRDANKRLAKGIMISSLAREAQEIRSHRLPVNFEAQKEKATPLSILSFPRICLYESVFVLNI